jgi:hypothetical protein
VSGTEHTRQREEGEHPEVDRAYERDQGGQVPEGQAEEVEYDGPDPTDDGSYEDEDQGV